MPGQDPLQYGEQIGQSLPGVGILQMLRGLGQRLPETAQGGLQAALEALGLRQPPAPPTFTRPGYAPMPTPRDAQGRPLPIDPNTGRPIGM
jgi:hypothetical protein